MRYLGVETAKRISKIGLGTAQFGSSRWGYGEVYAEREAQAVVRRAVQLGVTLFDTAEIYSSGRGERILGEALGEALGERRESVVLATKMFPVVPAASLVKQRAVASAARLGVPRLDLYQVHWPNPLVTDSTIMRGMRSLQRTGIVGDVGVSKYSLDRWRRAEDALGGRVLSNQIQYSLLDRSAERGLLPFAKAHRRVIIAFRPLALGLLSGKYHDATHMPSGVRANMALF